MLRTAAQVPRKRCVGPARSFAHAAEKGSASLRVLRVVCMTGQGVANW